jgi:hypothetical protein
MRRVLLFVLIYAASIHLWAVQSADSTANDAPNQTDWRSLYIGAGYGSDLLYSGYSLSGNKPYYSMDLLYSFNKEWTASAAIYNLDGAGPAIAFYDVAVGYRRYFNSWLDAGASLSAYFTNPSIQDTYFGNFGYLTLTGGFDWRILYSRLVYSALLDDSGSHYLQFKNSHYFSTRDFWKDKAYMDFNPTLNFVFGDRYKWITPSNEQPSQEADPEQILESSFGLMDMELSVPIAFNTTYFSIEAEPLYYIPIHKDPDFPADNGLFFFVNMYFRIF